MPQDSKKDGQNKGMIRFKENPFLDEHTNYPSRTKRMTLKRSANSTAFMVSQDGEDVYNSAMVAEKQVDSAQFVKIFVKEVSSLLEMKPAGQKVLIMLMWVMGTQWKINKDTVALDHYALEEFQEYAKKRGLKVFQRRTMTDGINELIKLKVIAAHQKRGWYFINPGFLWNGDRISFVRTYHRNKKLDDKNYNDQKDLFDDGGKK